MNYNYNDIIKVLSESVSKAIKLTCGSDTEGTSLFISMFDKFFDIMNVTDLNSWAKSRKPFKCHFLKGDDERLEVGYMGKNILIT